MNYFVQLPDSNMTLNLAHIMAVAWDFVAEPNLDPGYVTTVELSTGLGIYLTARDAQTLWKAMQVYNSRVFLAVHAAGPASAGGASSTANGNGKAANQYEAEPVAAQAQAGPNSNGNGRK